MRAPFLSGALADHPLAAPFAATVQRIHHRYAVEVVMELGVCPFLKDAESGFGEFHVVLDPALDPALLIRIAKAAGTSVCHVIYPLATEPSPPFERFAAGALGVIRKGDPRAPVMAVFHPAMSGDPSAPHRLVGLLRHSPDPFVQFVPNGLHEGGTVLQGSGNEPQIDNASRNFGRLVPQKIEGLITRLADIRAERDRTYAPFLEAFAQR